MTCEDCLKSKTELWHSFRGICQGCAARAMARSPDYYFAKKLGLTDDWNRALKALGLTDDAVRMAYEADYLNKGAT